VHLNPKEYKRHVKAKKILTDSVGATSMALFHHVLSKEEFAKHQVDGAKLAVRSTNLPIAVRAWNEVIRQLLEIPGRRHKGIPVLFQPMTDYFKPFGGYWMLTDEDSMFPEPEAVKAAVEKEVTEGEKE
jgi:hypothetical protein